MIAFEARSELLVALFLLVVTDMNLRIQCKSVVHESTTSFLKFTGYSVSIFALIISLKMAVVIKTLISPISVNSR